MGSNPVFRSQFLFQVQHTRHLFTHVMNARPEKIVKQLA